MTESDDNLYSTQILNNSVSQVVWFDLINRLFAICP